MRLYYKFQAIASDDSYTAKKALADPDNIKIYEGDRELGIERIKEIANSGARPNRTLSPVQLDDELRRQDKLARPSTKLGTTLHRIRMGG